MSGRHYSRPHPPILTRGDDQNTPCVDEWATFDALIDAPPQAVAAVRAEALDMCNRCPVRAACWAEHKGEVWVKVLTGKQRSGGAHQVKREPRVGPSLAELRAERKARLDKLETQGATFDEAAADQGVSRDALRKWMRDNGVTYRDEPKEPNRKMGTTVPVDGACGTPRGYRRHKKSGHAACDECLESHRQEGRDQRARARERGAA